MSLWSKAAAAVETVEAQEASNVTPLQRSLDSIEQAIKHMQAEDLELVAQRSRRLDEIEVINEQRAELSARMETQQRALIERMDSCGVEGKIKGESV